MFDFSTVHELSCREKSRQSQDLNLRPLGKNHRRYLCAVRPKHYSIPKLWLEIPQKIYEVSKICFKIFLCYWLQVKKVLLHFFLKSTREKKSGRGETRLEMCWCCDKQDVEGQKRRGFDSVSQKVNNFFPSVAKQTKLFDQVLETWLQSQVLTKD